MRKDEGSIIKRARIKSNLTQEEVAKAAGISSRQYRSIENEKCRTNVNTATIIADVLKRDIRELFPS